MISTIQQIFSGNALRLIIDPPANAKKWRVLRKGSDSFSGHTDTGAIVVHDGDCRVILDDDSLTNNQPAFYRPYYWDGVTWTPGATKSGTPAATYQESTTDAQWLVRERLERGLAVEVERGNFQTELGYIQVYTAPPSVDQGVRFPCVTVTLSCETPDERALGEDVIGMEMYDDEYFDSEGWLAQVQLEIVGWTLNSDERIELRKAIRRIIIANLTVFHSHGLAQINPVFQDVDAVSGEFNAPMYQVMCSFSCLAPVRVGANVDPLVNIEVRGYGQN